MGRRSKAEEIFEGVLLKAKNEREGDCLDIVFSEFRIFFNFCVHTYGRLGINIL
jgi:hypothetical protein